MNVSREILINFVGSCDPRAAPPTRLASQCAGVARPSSVLDVLSSGGLSPAGTELCSSHVAFAYPVGAAGAGALEGHFCSFFAIFRIFGVLLGLLKSTWLF